MRFEKRKAAWDEMLYAKTGLVGRHMEKIKNRLVALAKRQVGVDTGELRNSIKGDVRSGRTGLVARVGSNNRIAYMHHEGTRAHIITPKRAQTLRFAQRGRIVYTKLVRHPGTKPNRYLTDNLQTVVDD